MSGELVLITGVSGFIGANIAAEALKAGYRVRGAVRSQGSAAKLKEALAPQFEKELELVIVPDITADDAYDNVLEGVTNIIHVASPLPGQSTEYRKDTIDPAIHGTTNILNAALRYPDIKRIVITSSVAAFTPANAPDGFLLKESNAGEVQADPDTTFQNGFHAYWASKVLADKATTQFLEEKNPSFAVVTIHPTYVYGRNFLQKSAAELGGTNGVLFQILLGMIPPVDNNSVHVLDVADAHLKALDPSVPSGSKFLVSSPPYDWNDVLKYVKEHYPVLPWAESLVPKAKQVDVSNAEKVLGLKNYRSWEEQVKDVIEQQLALRQAQA